MGKVRRHNYNKQTNWDPQTQFPLPMNFPGVLTQDSAGEQGPHGSRRWWAPGEHIASPVAWLPEGSALAATAQNSLSPE